jgi:hypothetical protein
VKTCVLLFSNTNKQTRQGGARKKKRTIQQDDSISKGGGGRVKNSVWGEKKRDYSSKKK